MSARVDFDAVAPLYDRGPHREKSFDPELGAFLAAGAAARRVRILDVGCGTGAQLAANRRHLPRLRCVGLDESLEMLRVAQGRDPAVYWVRGDAAAMPFPDASFDYLSAQFMLHHVGRKLDFLAEAARVLRPGGRLTLRNLDPWSMPGWVLYRCFPAARERDQRDFMPVEEVVSVLTAAGLSDVRAERRRRADPVRLGDLLADVRQRQGRSQLIALADADYTAGIARLEAELARSGPEALLASEKCDVTITGEKRER